MTTLKKKNVASSAGLNKEALDFLKVLAKHNNREWFNDHKDRYLAAREHVIAFADSLLMEMNRHDKIETVSGKASLFRIYKDVRFSKAKVPYNTHWSGVLMRATKERRGSYYFHIESGNTYVICGFWGPDASDMKRIREDIAADYKTWKKVLNSKSLVATCGKMRGAQLISAPRGYDKNHPAIELLRYKQFMLKHEFTDKEVLAPGFVRKVNEVFKKMRPFLDHMSYVLTTDANGESLLD
ncbi:MAG TPA: DUF2461 domain-containing protein [Bacteroidia bacterium]|jgi:uncharacterized protein (TIGR02453 family)|nr:DUF2461 domain-containing protein [Bacteroidia bacterium]